MKVKWQMVKNLFFCIQRKKVFYAFLFFKKALFYGDEIGMSLQLLLNLGKRMYDGYFRPCCLDVSRKSVTFQNLAKRRQFSSENNDRYWWDFGSA